MENKGKAIGLRLCTKCNRLLGIFMESGYPIVLHGDGDLLYSHHQDRRHEDYSSKKNHYYDILTPLGKIIENGKSTSK